MADWTKGMVRTFEYWTVDPSTWRDSEKLDKVSACTITRDLEADSLGSVSVELGVDEWTYGEELYLREYMITQQFGVRERWPLGTHLVIPSDWEYDGFRGKSTMEGFTPIKELIDDGPQTGYTVEDGTTSEMAVYVADRYGRAPVIPSSGGVSITDPYVADDGETWYSLANNLLAKGSQMLDVNERGEILVSPKRDPRSVAPSYVFDDSNSSIILPAVQLHGNNAEVPNVVEVSYSADNVTYMSTVVDDDPGSVTSTVSRGRRVRYQELSPDLTDSPTQEDVDEAAEKALRNMKYTVWELSFTHAYVPDVRPGTGIRLDYEKAGIRADALVVSQTIECTPACLVTTTARFAR